MISPLRNFRDIGGLSTTNGERTITNMIFRTRQLVDIEGELLIDLISRLGARTIIDFRTTDERARYNQYPTDALSIINYISLPLECERIQVDKEIKDARNWKGYEYLYYHLITYEKGTFRKAFEILVEKENYPIIMHCIAGKDRTGIFLALLLLAINVKRELVIEDYLKSPNSEKKNILHLIDLVDKYGGILDYLKSIGVTKVLIEKIAAILLTNAPSSYDFLRFSDIF